jgi:hypothetical protein
VRLCRAGCRAKAGELGLPAGDAQEGGRAGKEGGRKEKEREKLKRKRADKEAEEKRRRKNSLLEVRGPA